MSAVSRASSSRPCGILRCVERCCPSAVHARRSEIDSTPRTRSMQARQATEFRYERRRQPLPRIDPWRDQLDGLLLANESKPPRERLTLIRVFEELRGLGYEGSYDA